MQMKEWKEYRLDEFCEQKREGYIPNGSDDLKYIGLEHINQQTLSLNSVGSSKDVTSNKFRFSAGDILFGKLRPYFRKVYRPNFSGVCSTDIMVLKAKEKFDQGFLFYFLANQDFIDLSNAGSAGTRMPRADWNHLRNSKWLIPPFESQKQIGAILSSLDEKIELNRQTVQTLEAIAQAIFKEWFVDFNFLGATGEMQESELGEIPKGWRVGELSEVISIKHGFAFKGEFFSDEETDDILLTPGNFKIGGGFNYSKFKYYKGEFPSEYTLNQGDIVVTMTDLSKDGDTLGYSALVPSIEGKRLLHNQRIGKILFREKELNHYIYFLLQQDDYRNFVLGSATGSTVRHTSPSRICEYRSVTPPIEILNRFNLVIQPLLDMMGANFQQIKTLIQLRESLLPKLIKGEIKI